VPTPPAPAAAQGEVLGAAAYHFTKTLSLRSSGADVSALQQILTDEGFFTGDITGYFGAVTQKALKAYQAKYGFEQTGTTGPLTRAQLNKGSVPSTTTTARGSSSLSATQISAILGLLQSFGADSATISSVNAALHGN
jgi:peptidoglycan hydrolase-like protein with peptidoglycan-binding domain